MELLLSNYPPMKTKCRTFSDMFYSMVPKSTELDIAVGYITSDSLMELQRIVELNTLKALNLTIGMHYLERFTKVEYNAALKLNDFLTENKCGEVRLVTPFRYHGKLYSYSDEQGAFAGIIGSNNLSSIVEGGTRVYESAVFLDDKNMACQINNFIRELVQTSTGNIRDLHIDNFREVNPLLEGHEFVKRVDPHEVAEVMLQRTNISFDIPIKPYEVCCHWKAVNPMITGHLGSYFYTFLTKCLISHGYRLSKCCSKCSDPCLRKAPSYQMKKSLNWWMHL